ncbi:MAG: phage portal protein [Hyphomicrobiales bacterium]|nr:MAG: phage portal protein [Hyphomicrobiales bacterium]
MNLFRKAAEFFTSPRRLSLTDPAGWPGLDGDLGQAVTESSVLNLSAAWACLNLLVGTVGSLPLMVYRDRPGGGREVAKDHPLYRLLHESPNAEQTTLDFLEQLCLSIELRGNGFAEKDYIGSKLVALTPVHPDAMTVRRIASGDISYRWRGLDGRYREGSSANILHIRGFGGDPLGGLSTLTHARKSFGLAASVNQAALRTFVNGLRPSGVLKFDKVMSPDKRAELEQLLAEKFMGAMNAGRPMVLEAGGTWEQLTFNPEEAQMLESRAFSVEEIARLFGVPPHMIGHTAGNTKLGSSIADMTEGFSKFSLRRRLRRIELAFMKQLLTAADIAAGIIIEFNLEGLLRGASDARARFYQLMLAAGVMTINEVRALENLPPVPGGDVPRMQSQNIPITQASAIGHNGGPPLEDDDAEDA